MSDTAALTGVGPWLTHAAVWIARHEDGTKVSDTVAPPPGQPTVLSHAAVWIVRREDGTKVSGSVPLRRLLAA